MSLASSMEVDPDHFDPEEYRAANPDISASVRGYAQALYHYLMVGREEGRQISPRVDTCDPLTESADNFLSSLLGASQCHEVAEKIALLHFLAKRTSLWGSTVRTLAEQVEKGDTSLVSLFRMWVREEVVAIQHPMEKQTSAEHRDTDTQLIPKILVDRVQILSSQESLDPVDWYRRLEQVRVSHPPVESSSSQGALVGRSTERSPSVAVLSSLYQADKYIDAHLLSLHQQTISNEAEYVLILVAPSKSVEEKVAQFQSSLPYVKVHVVSSVITIYEAWNLGIRTSTAPYITNANADDTRRKDSLQMQKETLDRMNSVDVVYQDYYFALEPHLEWSYYEKLGVRTHLPRVSAKRLLDEMNGPHCAPMWRRALHHELGYFNGALQAQGDNDFWFRCALAGKIFHKMEDIHVAYYSNPQGMSTRHLSPANREGEDLRRRYWWLSRDFRIGNQLFWTPRDQASGGV